LRPEDAGKRTRVDVGQTLVIRIPGNPTTGFQWKVASVTGDAVTAQGQATYVPSVAAGNVAGAGGTYLFSFRAVKPGSSTISLVYQRPWEKDKTPAGTFVTTIDVGGAQAPKPAAPTPATPQAAPTQPTPGQPSTPRVIPPTPGAVPPRPAPPKPQDPAP
jgi:inhibitor of cysteine peptidase